MARQSRAELDTHSHPPEGEPEGIDVPCCPQLVDHRCCDRLDFKYRLPRRVVVNVAGAPRAVTVELVIHVRFERCPGPLTLGELAYTTTLLPGEKVRLASTDRRSRFSFDSESKLSYRHAQASEENFYMSSLARDMSDLTVSESGSSQSRNWGDWEADAVAGGFLFFGGASASGEYDDRSTHSFMRSLRSHAESAHYRSQRATHTASSVSIGEVTSRTHAQGETEDHFESSSRVFENRNHCHAVSYFFWRLNRVWTLKFTIVAIERHVADPGAPTHVESRPPAALTGLSVLPTGILASASNRLEVEARAAKSVVAQAAVAEAALFAAGATTAAGRFAAQPMASTLLLERFVPLTAEARADALEQVDKQLATAGLIDRATGKVSERIIAELSWERELCLPTPGVLVKGCLDDCDVCERAVEEEIALDLERKRLENKLLEKQIELLEKSQEYRCCPAGTEEVPPDA